MARTMNHALRGVHQFLSQTCSQRYDCKRARRRCYTGRPTFFRRVPPGAPIHSSTCAGLLLKQILARRRANSTARARSHNTSRREGDAYVRALVAFGRARGAPSEGAKPENCQASHPSPPPLSLSRPGGRIFTRGPSRRSASSGRPCRSSAGSSGSIAGTGRPTSPPPAPGG